MINELRKSISKRCLFSILLANAATLLGYMLLNVIIFSNENPNLNEWNMKWNRTATSTCTLSGSCRNQVSIITTIYGVGTNRAKLRG